MSKSSEWHPPHPNEFITTQIHKEKIDDNESLSLLLMKMSRKDIHCSAGLSETVLLVLALFFSQLALVIPLSVEDEGVGKLKPVGTTTEFRTDLLLSVGGRRRLNPFQLCLGCKCCVSAADPATCITMPCCFGIECQLPNKPFGVCALVPKTCSCTSCAI